MLSAIIVAAGSSRRMGFDKLFAPLGGEPVVARTIDVFVRAGCVDEIIVVGRNDRLPELRGIVRKIGSDKIRHVVTGGARRQDSVQAGLNRVSTEATHVAVHDAARPLITSRQIERLLKACQMHGAAALAEPITDTIKRGDEDLLVSGGVDRSGLYAMQTPQMFSRDLLVRAYAAVASENLSVTDEASAVERLDAKVVLVPNDEFNPKITYPRDLLLAQAYLDHQRGR